MLLVMVLELSLRYNYHQSSGILYDEIGLLFSIFLQIFENKCNVLLHPFAFYPLVDVCK